MVAAAVKEAPTALCVLRGKGERHLIVVSRRPIVSDVDVFHIQEQEVFPFHCALFGDVRHRYRRHDVSLHVVRVTAARVAIAGRAFASHRIIIIVIIIVNLALTPAGCCCCWCSSLLSDLRALATTRVNAHGAKPGRLVRSRTTTVSNFGRVEGGTKR